MKKGDTSCRFVRSTLVVSDASTRRLRPVCCSEPMKLKRRSLPRNRRRRSYKMQRPGPMPGRCRCP